jgi:hypothetical protein
MKVMMKGIEIESKKKGDNFYRPFLSLFLIQK